MSFNIHENFLYWDSDFSRQFAVSSDCRWSTMKAAMNLLAQRGGMTIVETGCQRLRGDWGGGCSTLLFASYAKLMDNGTRVDTVDISEGHLNTAGQILVENDLLPWVSLHQCDSVEYLRDWSIHHGEGLEPTIDLLYLDSFDYPFGKILNAHGGREDIQAAIAKVQAIPTKEIIDQFAEVIAPCQQHCLDELMAALPALGPKSIVLIDDNSLAGGGKSRTAKEWLAKNGWHVLIDHQQSMWIRA